MNEFQIITAFKDDEFDKVVRLLKNNYWNLEIALSKYFDGNLEEQADAPAAPGSSEAGLERERELNIQQLNEMMNGHGTGTGTGTGSGSGNGTGNGNGLGFIELPIVRPLSNKWKLQPGINSLSVWDQFTASPILFILLLIPRALTFLFTAIGFVFDYFVPQETANSLPREPTLREFSFTKFYEDTIAEKSSIEFFEGEFNDAFNIAKLENKFILVVLIKNNRDSVQFLKTVLNNDSVKDLIASEEVLVYPGNVEEYQSYELARAIRARSFPSCYLIGNVSNGMSGVSSMSLLGKVPTKSLNSFKQRLARDIDRFKPELILKRLEQEELNYSRKLRELQDKAYEESLLADKIKFMEKEEQAKQEQARLERAEFNEKNKLVFYAMMLNKFAELDAQLEGLAKSEQTRIQFRTPSGERIVQNFTRDTSLFDIYAFIDLKGYLGGDGGAREQLEQLAREQVDSGYEHSFNFELISPFPRFVVPVDAQKRVAEVQQLWPNGNLLVEYDVDEQDG